MEGKELRLSPSFFGSLLMSITLQDPRREVQKILQFLGKELAEGAVERILHHTSFQEMKKNPAANYETMVPTLMDHSLSPFLRKGGVWLVVEDLGGMFLDCISAPMCGYKYFMCVRIYSVIFLPPGISGDWKNHFTVAQNERFDQHYQEHMAGSDLHFQMEV